MVCLYSSIILATCRQLVKKNLWPVDLHVISLVFSSLLLFCIWSSLGFVYFLILLLSLDTVVVELSFVCNQQMCLLMWPRTANLEACWWWCSQCPFISWFCPGINHVDEEILILEEMVHLALKAQGVLHLQMKQMWPN